MSPSAAGPSHSGAGTQYLALYEQDEACALGTAHTAVSTESGSMETLDASWTGTDFDVSGQSQDSLSFSLGGARKLSPRLSLSTNMAARSFPSSVGGENQTYDLSFGVNSSLGRYSSIGANLSHRVFDGNTAAGYTEQRISLSFRTKFL